VDEAQHRRPHGVRHARLRDAAPVPPAASYPKWSSFISAGQTAANKSDVAGVKGACNGCHKAKGPDGATNYKDMYKANPDPGLEAWAVANTH
jgi:cytochrome c553